MKILAVHVGQDQVEAVQPKSPGKCYKNVT